MQLLELAFVLEFDADRALLLDQDPGCQRTGEHRQVGPRQIRCEVSLGGTEAFAVLLRNLVGAHALLVGPVEVGVQSDAGLHTGLHEQGGETVGRGQVLDVERAAACVQSVGAALVGGARRSEYLGQAGRIDTGRGTHAFEVRRVGLSQELHAPADLSVDRSRVEHVNAFAALAMRVLVAEGEKESQILRAQAKKEAQILEAEAEKQAMILKADAVRQQKILEAQGEAESIELVQTALAESLVKLNNSNPAQNVIALKSLEAFIKAADGKATKIIIPSEIQSMAGLAASLKELVTDKPLDTVKK